MPPGYGLVASAKLFYFPGNDGLFSNLSMDFFENSYRISPLNVDPIVHIDFIGLGK